MKFSLTILTLLALLAATVAVYGQTASVGSHWRQVEDTLEPADDIASVNISSFGDDTDFSTADGWQTQVGRVSEIYGIHTHDSGVDACKVTQRSPASVRIEDCTVHINGVEYDFLTSTFSGFTNIPIVLDSTFIGMTISNYTTQDNFFSDSDLDTIIPLARVQERIDGQLSVFDLRNIVSGVDKKDYKYRRGAVGPAIGVDGGLVPIETGTRNLNLSTGSFYGEEGEEHVVPAFNLISTVSLWRTTGSFDSWTSTGRDVFQLDNVFYNDVDNGGLVAAQNNNRYIYQVLAASAAGGTVRGVDTGRKPTFFSFYGPDEYVSLEGARNSNIDLGSFSSSTPRLVIIAKIITNKNNAAIVDIWDERRFITTPSGSSVTIPTTASLQTVYDNSPNGGTAEIITNDTNGALTIAPGLNGVSDKVLEIEQNNGHDIFGVYTTHAEIGFSNGTSIKADNNTTAGNTRLMLYDIDNGRLERVSVGVADTGGVGFKVLRIPN
jgi:hypothetical protein